jgi:hypothetical protein
MFSQSTLRHTMFSHSRSVVLRVSRCLLVGFLNKNLAIILFHYWYLSNLFFQIWGFGGLFWSCAYSFLLGFTGILWFSPMLLSIYPDFGILSTFFGILGLFQNMIFLQMRSLDWCIIWLFFINIKLILIPLYSCIVTLYSIIWYICN